MMSTSDKESSHRSRDERSSRTEDSQSRNKSSDETMGSNDKESSRRSRDKRSSGREVSRRKRSGGNVSVVDLSFLLSNLILTVKYLFASKVITA